MFFFFIFLAVAVGGILMFDGIFRKMDKRRIKIGLLTMSFPFIILIGITVFGSIIELFEREPSFEELVGEYEIVDASNLNIDKKSYDQYKLILKDGRFNLTPTPFIDLCQNGTYEVDYSYDYNEIAFNCGGYYMAHIDKGFKSHRIEFIIGDPDSGESIYFGKKKAKR